MEYSELIAARYSVRAYRPDPVEEEKLEAVLEAARLAPTAANRQPFQLVVMHTAGREEEIGRIYRKAWFVQAPIVIGVCAISSLAWVREGDRFNARMIDAAIVADHLILEAANPGLGTCWVAAFNVEAARACWSSPMKPSRSSSRRSVTRPTSPVQNPQTPERIGALRALVICHCLVTLFPVSCELRCWVVGLYSVVFF